MAKSLYKEDFVLPTEEIFKNPDVLKDDYIPDRFLFRDKERNRIMKEIGLYFRDKRLIPNDFYIYGPPGTGKTHMMKKIMREVNEFAERYEFNVRMIYASFKGKTYIQGIGELAGIKVKLKSGYTPNELLNALVENKLMKNDLTGIIFDEIDKMRITGYVKGSHEKNDIDELIGIFTKLHESYSHVNIFSVFISNKDINKFLSSPTKSTFSPTHIYFRNYKADEMFEILKDRVKDAFVGDVIDEDTLIYLVRRVSNAGDLRLGMKTLFNAGKILMLYGKKKITTKEIDMAFEEVQKNMIRERISKLDDTSLLIIYYTALLQKEGKKPRMTEVYEKYKNTAIRPLSFNYISNFVIPRLESQGLIMNNVKGMGRGKGKSRFLNVEDDYINEILDICRVEIHKKLNVEGI